MSTQDDINPKFYNGIIGFMETEEATTFMEELKNASLLQKLEAASFELITQLKTQSETKKYLEDALKKDEKSGLKGYWAWCLTRSQTFSKYCNTRDDLDALGYLSDIEVVVDPRDARAFDLIFTFSENPYFSNPTLTKSFVLAPTSSSAPTTSKGKSPSSTSFPALTASEQLGRGRPTGLSSSEKITDTPEGDKVVPGGREANGEWVWEEVRKGLKVVESNEFEEFDDLVGLKTEIHWKSDEKNLLKILPRGGPPAKDGGDDELEEEDVDMDDEENEGDRGSWFHWFGDEESHSALELGLILSRDIVFNSFDYFLGDGGDCEPDLDDDFSLDEENDEVNGEEEIDLEDEEVERPKKRMRKN